MSNLQASQADTTHGLYDFRNNEALLDAVRKDIGGDTITHENVHNLVSSLSSVGLMLIMMRKASLLDRSKQWLYDAILEKVQRVQEVTATTVEYYTIWLEKGKAAFDKQIQSLYQNHEYRRYFNEFQDIHKTLHTEDEVTRLINNVLSLAVMSMNIDISIFQAAAFRSKAELDDFFKKSENGPRYLPAARFKILANYHLRNMHDEETARKLAEVKAATVEGNCTLLCRQVVRSIYADSQFLERIETRIEQISLEPGKIIYYENVDLKNLAVYPIDLNSTTWKREHDIVDLDTMIGQLQGAPDKYLVFAHPVSGLEDVPMLQCIDSSKLSLSCIYSYGVIPWLLDHLSNRIVFVRTKLYRHWKDALLERKKRHYILMDSSMAGNLGYIQEEFQNGKYTYFYQDSYMVVLVFNAFCTLIQPVIPEGKKELPYVLDQYGIDYVEYAVSGLYGDSAPRELARIGFETASDERLAQEFIESGSKLKAVEHLFSGKNGAFSSNLRNQILQSVRETKQSRI